MCLHLFSANLPTRTFRCNFRTLPGVRPTVSSATRPTLVRGRYNFDNTLFRSNKLPPVRSNPIRIHSSNFSWHPARIQARQIKWRTRLASWSASTPPTPRRRRQLKNFRHLLSLTTKRGNTWKLLVSPSRKSRRGNGQISTRTRSLAICFRLKMSSGLFFSPAMTIQRIGLCSPWRG